MTTEEKIQKWLQNKNGGRYNAVCFGRAIVFEDPSRKSRISTWDTEAGAVMRDATPLQIAAELRRFRENYPNVRVLVTRKNPKKSGSSEAWVKFDL